MLGQETRNNNGQARSCEAEFRANAANESRSLLGDLRFNGISMKDNLRGKRRRTRQTSENQWLAKFSLSRSIAMRYTSTACDFPVPWRRFVSRCPSISFSGSTETSLAAKPASGILGLAEAISANALNAFRQETIRYDFRK
jgi:hypothetical protein